MKNIQDIQSFVKYKAPICLIFDYEGVLSSYANTFSTDNFNPMMKRVLENYAKKSYIKVVILIRGNDKKFIKKLKMSAKNLEFYSPEKLEIEDLYENMDAKMKIVYFGDDISVVEKIKEKDGVLVCVDYTDEKVKKQASFSITSSKLEEFIIQTNNLYL